MLNNWSGDDKPTRSDFVRDNILIDTAIWQHTADPYLHLSNAEKTRVSDPYVVTVYQGDDEDQRVINLGFTPKMAVCFASDEPPFALDNGAVVINCCIGVSGSGASGGFIVGNSGVILNHNTTGSVRYNLNSSDCQYVLVAFR